MFFVMKTNKQKRKKTLNWLRSSTRSYWNSEALLWSLKRNRDSVSSTRHCLRRALIFIVEVQDAMLVKLLKIILENIHKEIFKLCIQRTFGETSSIENSINRTSLKDQLTLHITLIISAPTLAFKWVSSCEWSDWCKQGSEILCQAQPIEASRDRRREWCESFMLIWCTYAILLMWWNNSIKEHPNEAHEMPFSKCGYPTSDRRVSDVQMSPQSAHGEERKTVFVFV